MFFTFCVISVDFKKKLSCFLSYRRGVHLNNPFYSVWASESRSKVAVSFKYLFFIIKSNLAVRLPLTSKLCFSYLKPHITFISVAGISVCLYFFSLCRMVYCVFRTIGGKMQQLPTMPEARRLRYKV